MLAGVNIYLIKWHTRAVIYQNGHGKNVWEKNVQNKKKKSPKQTYYIKNITL